MLYRRPSQRRGAGEEGIHGRARSSKLEESGVFGLLFSGRGKEL